MRATRDSPHRQAAQARADLKRANNLAATVGILVCVLLSRPCRAERLALRAYTAADGLASNQVNQALQDSRGFLWIATEDGLSRFDGRTFRNFTRADGLPDSAVDALAESEGGDLWIGTHATRLPPEVNSANGTDDQLLFAA